VADLSTGSWSVSCVVTPITSWCPWGAWSGDARVAVERLRERGAKVGLLKVRVFRPFPFEEVRDYLRNCKGVLVMDRAYSFGSGGILVNEVKVSLYGHDVPVHSLVGG